MNDLKKFLKDGGNIVCGKHSCLRLLKSGEVEKVYLSSDCVNDLRGEVKMLAENCGINVVELGVSSAELAGLCKRNYFVSVLCY